MNVAAQLDELVIVDGLRDAWAGCGDGGCLGLRGLRVGHGGAGHQGQAYGIGRRRSGDAGVFIVGPIRKLRLCFAENSSGCCDEAAKNLCEKS